MGIILLSIVGLLILHGGSSYILLTANMEDVQSVMKQLSSSPVLEQVKQMWRRATLQFKRELNKPLRRSGTNDMGIEDKKENDKMADELRNMEAFLSLENATQIIDTAKQIIEDLEA